MELESLIFDSNHQEISRGDIYLTFYNVVFKKSTNINFYHAFLFSDIKDISPKSYTIKGFMYCTLALTVKLILRLLVTF